MERKTRLVRKRVIAQGGADDRIRVDRPMRARRSDQLLDDRPARSDEVAHAGRARRVGHGNHSLAGLLLTYKGGVRGKAMLRVYRVWVAGEDPAREEGREVYARSMGRASLLAEASTGRAATYVEEIREPLPFFNPRVECWS